MVLRVFLKGFCTVSLYPLMLLAFAQIVSWDSESKLHFLSNSFFISEAISLILAWLSHQTIPIFLVMGRHHLTQTRDFREHCATPTQVSPNPCHWKTAGYSDEVLKDASSFYQ